MGEYLYTFGLVTIGIVLLWFGYTLLMRQLSGIKKILKKPQKKQVKGKASPGDPQVCPVCSSELEKGDLVKTLAFPSITGGRDRLMHIRGCMYCIEGNLKRKCPVCRQSLAGDDVLVARMFDRKFRRSHVHVLGCSQCRKSTCGILTQDKLL